MTTVPLSMPWVPPGPRPARVGPVVSSSGSMSATTTPWTPELSRFPT
jgi:hypothetical protein